MGRKLKGTKRQRESQDAGSSHAGEAWNDTAADPPLALIAVCSSNDDVAVACGPRLRVWSSRKASTVELPDAQGHGSTVRGIAFSPDGCYFLAGSDDKLAQVWDTKNWELLNTWRTPKKISTVTFTADSKWAIFADKFGDVFRGQVQAAANAPAAASGHMAAPVPGTAAHTAGGETEPVGGTQGKRKQAAQQDAPGGTSCHAKPALLLGHLCSVVTSVTCSPDGRFVATTDKDRKVRVSCLPKDSQQGAHEVQSVCLGHLRFVTCSAFMSGAIPSDTGLQSSQAWLLTGGGDGTVRLWDHVANKQLACWHVPASRAAQGHAAAAAAAAAHEGDAAAAGTSASPQNGQATPVNGTQPSPKPTESAASQAEGMPSEKPCAPAEAAAAHQAGDSSAAPDTVTAAAAAAAAGAAAAINGAPTTAAPEEADAAASQGAAHAPQHAAAACEEKAGEYVAHEGGGVAPGTGDAAQAAGEQPTVLALAVLPSGLVAAAVEGLDQVFVLKCHPGEGRLQLQQEVQLAGMQLPSSLQADSAGRLWVAGMPSDMRAPAACLGRAKCSGGEQQGLVDDTQQLPEPMLEALAARHERQGRADAQQSQQRAQAQLHSMLTLTLKCSQTLIKQIRYAASAVSLSKLAAGLRVTIFSSRKQPLAWPQE